MFGIIPKTMWQRLIPADDNNLIPMVTNLFVLRAHNTVTLFDAGLGDTLTEREEKVYGVDGPSHLDERLLQMGLEPEDIDFVILTHLHTDHCGGAVKRVNGEYRPRFPKATYFASGKEWQAAMNPNERTSAAYLPERLNALEESGQVQLIEGDTILPNGIRAVHTGGHSDGHFGLEIESGGKQVWYHGDLFPTTAHLRVPWIPATDLYPMETLEMKRRLPPLIVQGNVVLAFDHDTRVQLGTVSMEGKNPVATPVK